MPAFERIIILRHAIIINSVFANWKRCTFEVVMSGKRLIVVRAMPKHEAMRVAKPIMRQIPIMRNAHCETAGNQIGVPGA